MSKTRYVVSLHHFAVSSYNFTYPPFLSFRTSVLPRSFSPDHPNTGTATSESPTAMATAEMAQTQHEQLATNNKDLLTTGAYSDLTLRCQGKGKPLDISYTGHHGHSKLWQAQAWTKINQFTVASDLILCRIFLFLEP